jgi:hypothetical protein
MARRPGNTLERWKWRWLGHARAQFRAAGHPSLFLAPRDRSITRVSEIRDGAKHRAVRAASDTELDAYLAAWPDVDPTPA